MTTDILLQDNLDFRRRDTGSGDDLLIGERWETMALFLYLVRDIQNILSSLSESQGRAIKQQLVQKVIVKGIALGLDIATIDQIMQSNDLNKTFNLEIKTKNV